MAGIPLNTFRTVTKVVPYSANQDAPSAPYTTANLYAIYQAPPGISSIILYCQIANIGVSNQTVSMWFYRPSTGIFTEIVKKIMIPPHDTMSMLDGKLVLETSDLIFVAGSATYTAGPPETSDLKLIASILESANQ